MKRHRGNASDIGDDTASEGDDDGVAVGAVRDERFEDLLDGGPLFVDFAWREDDGAADGDVGTAESIDGGLHVEGFDILVGDDKHG